MLCLGRAYPGEAQGRIPCTLLPISLLMHKRKDCGCCTLGPHIIMPATRSCPHLPTESPRSRGTLDQLLRAHEHGILGTSNSRTVKCQGGKGSARPESNVSRVGNGRGSQRCHVRQSPSLYLMLLGTLGCKLPLGFNSTSRQRA